MAITVRTVTTFPLDDAQRDFNINFDYLARKFVQVAVIDSTLSKPRKELVLGTDFRFTTKTTLNTTIAWGPNDGYDRIEIRRVTSTTERVVDFADGSILRATDLNASQVQAIHIAEEARDAALLAMPQDDMGNLDARNRRIVRLADGIESTDAINKGQLDSTLGEAGGILEDIQQLEKDIHGYLENFADDTSMVRGVSWVYNGGSANGGETSFVIAKEGRIVAVPYIEVNGSRQLRGYHFDYDSITKTITLAKPLVAGDFVVCQTAESVIPFLDLIAGPTGASQIGVSGGGTVQDTITHVTPEMFGAVGPDHTAALKSAFAYPNVQLKPGKVYTVSDVLPASNLKNLKGNGAAIKYVGPVTSGMTLISMGKSKGALTGLSIPVTAGSATVTIPGISAIASVGDLLSIRSSTQRLSAPESNYMFGQRCVIQSITGDTVRLVEPFFESFTAVSCTVHSGEPLSVDGLTIDMTSVGSTTALIETLSMTGVRLSVSRCAIYGSSYGSAGLVLQGCNAHVDRSVIFGFLNANGVSSGGRTGYGVYIDCNNTVIDGNTIGGCKHAITCASRSFVMRGLTVTGNTVSSIGATNPEAVLDLHANVLGSPVFSKNTISAARSAFGIRNGGAKIMDNTIYCDRSGEATPALIGLDEYPDVYSVEVSGNILKCSSNLRLLSISEINSLNNLVVSGNRGTIGSIIDQAMNLVSINDLTIEDNVLSGMYGILNASRRSVASTQPMFSKLDRARIKNNRFDCGANTVASNVISLWSNANTPASSKLAVIDLEFDGNHITSAHTPIFLDLVRLVGVTSFSNNTLSHATSAGTTTPPTQSSIALTNVNVEMLEAHGNVMSGRIRFTTAVTQRSTNIAYPTEDFALAVRILGNSGLGVTFENLTTTGFGFKIDHSAVRGNTFVSPYGTTIGVVTSNGLTGWTGGVLDISDNTLLPASGNSVGIGVGFQTHSIVIRGNLLGAPIADSSTPRVPPAFNTSL